MYLIRIKSKETLHEISDVSDVQIVLKEKDIVPVLNHYTMEVQR
jgi:hypothetical protein